MLLFFTIEFKSSIQKKKKIIFEEQIARSSQDNFDFEGKKGRMRIYATDNKILYKAKMVSSVERN